MTLRQMEILCAVAHTGKMNAAAKELFISTASVSQAILEIEDEMGFKVFERLAKKLYVTEAGQRLIEYCSHILGLYQEMTQSMKTQANSITLRIGASSTVGINLMPDIVHRCKDKCPTTVFKVQVDNKQCIEKRILNSELDVALIDGTVTHPDLIARPVIKDQLVIVCGKNYPLYGVPSLTKEQLVQHPFIMRESGSSSREQFENFLNQEQLRININWECNNYESVKNAVLNNYGLTAISRRLVAAELKTGSLWELPVEDYKFIHYINLVFHKNKYFFPALKCFVSICDNKC